LTEDSVDWDAAPLLDNELIGSIFADGTDWRGKPVRIPVCMVLDLWSQPQKENPLRIEKLATGWLGHQPWVGQAKLVNFVSPFEHETVRRRLDQVTARAFFFKNLAYEPKGGGAGITPFFVVHSMQIANPVEAKGLHQLMWVVGGIFMVLVVAIVLLLRRDQARSRALHEDLLRRRRMRRARLST
jgi:preprotein translocase subunit SecG